MYFIEGCEGETTCGNLPTQFFDLPKEQTFVRYIFIRVNGILSRMQNNIPQSLPLKVEKKSKNVGCGRIIVWRGILFYIIFFLIMPQVDFIFI